MDVSAPAQIVTAPAQPPATGAVVYTALFLVADPYLLMFLHVPLLFLALLLLFHHHLLLLLSFFFLHFFLGFLIKY